MQLETQEVQCPKCGASHGVPVPDGGVELKIKGYATPFEEPTKIECTGGHAFWVYYC